ncbi:MAG: LPS export ABC transporter permease LptG [Arenicellales bacterium]|nr:LPS export ABC transporter permease LptG [Arenicellales bacterium]
MRLLDLYLGRTILNQVLLVMSVLAGIFMFVTFVDQISYLGTGRYGLWDAMWFVLLSTPRIIYEVFPMAVLLGAILGLSLLALGSELIVMRSSGISISQITAAALKLGVVLAVFALVIGEFVAPRSETMAQRVRAAALESSIERKGNSGLWIRDKNMYVNIGEVLPDLTLQDVRIFEFDGADQLRLLLSADIGRPHERSIDVDRLKKSATSVRDECDQDAGEHWHLQQVQQTIIDEQGRVDPDSDPDLRACWYTPVTPQMMSIFLVQPEQLSIGQLRHYIGHLAANSQDTRHFELAYWSKLVLPLSMGVMLILAIPFVFGNLRAGGMGRNLFIGIMIGMVFFAANKALGYIVLVYNLPPIAGATLPTVVFLLAAVWLYRQIE